MAETASPGSQRGPSSAGSAGGDMKDQAKQQAQNVAGQAKSQLRSQVDQRSTQAGQQISQQAQDMRSVGEQLRSQGKQGPARMADQVAGRVEGLGSWLTTSSGDQILHDVEEFGRRQPWAVMAGGLALGFLASRFLKASSRDRYQHRVGWTNERYGRQLPERTSEERFTRAGSSHEV
jgi:glucan phosphorylase